MQLRLSAATVCVIALSCAMQIAQAQSPAPPEGILFQNVRVFDGKSTALSAPSNVLVIGNKISAVSAAPITPDPQAKVRTIEGRGRTLMPGLIDAHWHAMLIGLDQTSTLLADVGFLNLVAANVAKQTLMQGFTSVRDMGGPAFGLRMAIDRGVTPGPRIFPSGAMISQTSGHADFRLPYEVPRAPNAGLSRPEATNAAIVADGVPAVLQRVREQLMLGATQIKITTGGGSSSLYDPLDVTQYTPEEVRAAVAAAENWGTYVAVHTYTPRAIRMSVEAGVKSIEHGQLVDEDTAKLMAQKGVWWSLQPFLADEDANPKTGESLKKQQQVQQGTDRAYRLAKKYRIKTAFGTDILFNAKGLARHTALLAKLTRWYTPGEVLKMATGDNAQLLALSGPRYPYDGKLGVIEVGALADLILIDGDPIANIGLIEDPEKNFVLIVKDGRVVKDGLSAARSD